MGFLGFWGIESDCLLVYAKAKRTRQLGEDLKNANKAFLSGPYAGFRFLSKYSLLLLNLKNV